MLVHQRVLGLLEGDDFHRMILRSIDFTALLLACVNCMSRGLRLKSQDGLTKAIEKQTIILTSPIKQLYYIYIYTLGFELSHEHVNNTSWHHLPSQTRNPPPLENLPFKPATSPGSGKNQLRKRRCLKMSPQNGKFTLSKNHENKQMTSRYHVFLQTYLPIIRLANQA